jgi:hypothetical protein
LVEVATAQASTPVRFERDRDVTTVTTLRRLGV